MNATTAPLYRTILFDLDGTLTDPREGITRSIRYALRKRGIEPPPDPALDCWIGPPLEDSFRERAGLGAADAKQAVADYREYFADRGIFENRVYPGIPELLAALCAAGRRLLLATSKPTPYAQRILAHFDLAQRFDAVVGSFLDGRRTDKAEIVAAALAQSDAAWHPPVMVGDRRHDVAGARANRIDAIAVGWGYGSEREIRAAAPTWHAPDLPALGLLLQLP